MKDQPPNPSPEPTAVPPPLRSEGGWSACVALPPSSDFGAAELNLNYEIGLPFYSSASGIIYIWL
jgi:hypothetical protein